MNAFSICLSVISLIISMISLGYTYYANKFSIDITDFTAKKDRGHVLIEYWIINNSSKYLKIMNIRFSGKDNHITPLDFDPEEFDQLEAKRKSDEWIKKQKRLFLIPFPEDNPYRFASTDIAIKHAHDNLYKPNLPMSLKPYGEYRVKYYISDVPDRITVYTDKLVGLKRYKSFPTNVN